MTSSSGFCNLILCRNREASSPVGEGSPFRVFEDSLLGLLCRDAVAVAAITPHLYDLQENGPSLELMRELSGSLVVLSWLPARACYWRLRAARICGIPVSLEQNATTTKLDNASLEPSSPDDASHEDSRRIWCLDLHEFSRPEDCLAAVHRVLAEVGVGDGATCKDAARGDATCKDATRGDATRGDAAELHDSVEPASPRWYPVIDRDRCVNCLECLNFCLFGVFGLDDSETILVEQADACRPGCPACARVCPAGAILFPEHGDPTISGRAARQATIPTSGGASLLPLFDPLARASAERAAAQSDASDRPAPPRKETSSDEDVRLNKLVDDLDSLDL